MARYGVYPRSKNLSFTSPFAVRLVEQSLGNILTHYVNVVTPVISSGETTLQPKPLSLYNVVDGGAHIVRFNGESVALKLIFDVPHGYRINTYDSSGYLLESIFEPKTSDIDFVMPDTGGDAGLIDYVNEVVKSIVLGDITLQAHPSVPYYLADGGGWITRHGGGEVAHTVMIDTNNGYRTNSYDSDGYLIDSKFTEI